MPYGLEQKYIDAINNIFSLHTNIQRAILYGSRAKGNYRPNSDIDITLQGEALNYSQLVKIENELDDLMLPYSLDLSIFHQIENPKLISHIERVGKVFYSN